MKERPIIFSAPMVRAILDGRKTQTRRIVKPQPPSVEAVHAVCGAGFGIYPHVSAPDQFCVSGAVWTVRQLMGGESAPLHWKCPYGVPGDRLWVRETWRASSMYDLAPPREIPPGGSCWWEADKSARKWLGERSGKLRPSIHMPRWASRLTLEIVSVRVERLQAITAYDAFCEGVTVEIPAGADPSNQKFPDGFETWHKQKQDRWFEEIATATYMAQCVAGERAVAAYRTLWESINGPGSWEANSWVWVLEFKRVEEVSE